MPGMSPVIKKNSVAMLSVLFLIVSLCYAQGISSHKDRGKLTEGCGSCHVGHGVPGTPMLPEKEERFCYTCHGYGKGRSSLEINRKLLPGIDIQNIEAEFQKQSHHPVEYEGMHIYGEESLKTRKNIQRHSECTDCHETHNNDFKFESPEAILAETGRTVRSVSGLEDEYLLCYKCHASSNIFGTPGQKIDLDFDTGNASYHPVEARGNNGFVPSIISGPGRDRITCTSCHGNNDPGGPKGPHGSDYSPLLVDHYSRLDRMPEDSFQYALCYRCHSRDSILSDQSFPEHKRHIVNVGTSCATCHNAHGSVRYEHLINFNYGTFGSPVEPSSSGRLDYYSAGAGSGECYLSCHGADHNPKTY